MVLNFKMQMTRERKNSRTDLDVCLEGRKNSSTVSYNNVDRVA